MGIIAVTEFLLIALLAGIGISVMAGPLGTFVVWRRMAYLGDTLAHSALLGVALGIVLSLNLTITIVVVCVALALIIVLLQYKQILSSDTLLGILAHASLALGLVTIALFADQGINVNSYLFGDLLASSWNDVWLIFAVVALVIVALLRYWRPLLSMTVHEELAQVEGVNVAAMKMLLMVLTALVIALAMKAVGVLLVTALLIIPAAASRRFVKAPEHMAVLASAMGSCAVAGGLAASYFLDLPAGPAVVLAATLFFGLSLLQPQR